MVFRAWSSLFDGAWRFVDGWLLGLGVCGCWVCFHGVWGVIWILVRDGGSDGFGVGCVDACGNGLCERNDFLWEKKEGDGEKTIAASGVVGDGGEKGEIVLQIEIRGDKESGTDYFCGIRKREKRNSKSYKRSMHI
ncbi:hypothetical protein H5410_059699 [Solanum commersonii]|uniref:Transmembrane protein n=1 Tax=Solanum commersonii TaxID=4109 RepID=A0A9J5W349_SOLCO|nr:hypothetical protein H5410_059699 [Solanum commersonii]